MSTFVSRPKTTSSAKTTSAKSTPGQESPNPPSPISAKDALPLSRKLKQNLFLPTPSHLNSTPTRQCDPLDRTNTIFDI